MNTTHVLVSIAACAVLAACGSSEAPTPDAPAAAAPAVAANAAEQQHDTPAPTPAEGASTMAVLEQTLAAMKQLQ